MEFLFQHAYLGAEADWIAVDQSGRLGYFSTAGAGPIPTTFERDMDCEDIFETILALEVSGSMNLVGQHEGSLNDWIEVARRGIFAFDWVSEVNCYSLVAKPNNLLSVSDLNANLRSTVSKFFIDVDFRDEHLGAGLW